MSFSAAETAACSRLVELALQEDLGAPIHLDVTSQALIPADLTGQAVFVARRDGVVAGLPAVALVLATEGAALHFAPLCDDGARVKADQPLARVDGGVQAMLRTERTALNFLQRLSGIATLTRQYVDAIAGCSCHILDTRKTTPGWRLLEKYAVRCGGAHNHRMGLFDMILIKDNHLAAVAQGRTIADVLRLARKDAEVPVEIEVDSIGQLREALSAPARPDMVLLDNMSLEQMREAVRLRNQLAPGILLEASGGVTLSTVRAIAETGVDRISAGALTHSAVALDIALDYVL